MQSTMNTCEGNVDYGMSSIWDWAGRIACQYILNFVGLEDNQKTWLKGVIIIDVFQYVIYVDGEFVDISVMFKMWCLR